MRRLVLFRHAKAERNALSGEDYDRALVERGQSDARLVGQALSQAGVNPDLALVSPAARTRETWAASGLAGDRTQMRFDKSLYNASARVLRQAVEAVEDEAETLVLIGHNPGLQELAVRYLIDAAASGAVLERVSGKFPTATAVLYDVDPAGRPMFAGLFYAKDYGGGGED